MRAFRCHPVCREPRKAILLSLLGIRWALPLELLDIVRGISPQDARKDLGPRCYGSTGTELIPEIQEATFDEKNVSDDGHVGPICRY